MGTVIKPELSEKNKYWVNKHRYYELKHFCLQYPLWKKLYSEIEFIGGSRFDSIGRYSGNHMHSDPTSRLAEQRLSYYDRIQLVERIAMEADPELADYILKAVTENLSYNNLKSKINMPCGRDMYYDRYRRFFWLLDKNRD